MVVRMINMRTTTPPRLLLCQVSAAGAAAVIVVVHLLKRRRELRHRRTPSTSCSFDGEHRVNSGGHSQIDDPPRSPTLEGCNATDDAGRQQLDYDVIVVGAGPSGSTVAYHLAKAEASKSAEKLRVLLLERATFPRPKYCGDAFCSQALDIMEEMEWDATSGMSVLDAIRQRGLCRPVERGGFVSPFGYRCINDGDMAGGGDGDGTGGAKYGSSESVRTYAIKRIVADEFLARAAERAGAELREGTEADASGVSFDPSSGGFWRVPLKTRSINAGGKRHRPSGGDDRVGDSTTTTETNETRTVVTGRVLVAADGATSYLARHLGLVTTDPDSVCSHRYVLGGTHHLHDVDGVMFFNRSVLPGYSALFRHHDDDVYLGTYILPGGDATSRCIPGFEEEMATRHPYVRDALLGVDDDLSSLRDVRWRVDESAGENGRIRVAPIRTGGEAVTYGDHILVVGDAAGQTDPMTGEGIHTSMVAAKLAASVIVHRMFDRGDFTSVSTRVYQEAWTSSFGDDFRWSAAGAALIRRFPILLDAACRYGRERGGQAFLDEFGLIMTGVRPKSTFLRPGLAIPIGLYLLREVFAQYVLGVKPLVPQDIGHALVDRQRKKKVS